MLCKHCHKEIVLVPSAAERTKKYGGTPNDYTRLFEYHAACQLELREQGTRELMQRLTR